MIKVLRRPVESALASAVAVDHAAGHIFTAGDGVVERRDGQPGLHPRVDGVAHDPVGVDVLDRAEVELAFTGAVLGDVGQPQLVRATGGESRRTRSSWTGGPGFLPLRPRFFPNTDHQPDCEQSFHAVRSAIDSPASRASSTRNR
jgi:hypothetical protein